MDNVTLNSGIIDLNDYVSDTATSAKDEKKVADVTDNSVVNEKEKTEKVDTTEKGTKKSKQNSYRTERCKVLKHNKAGKTLDISFKGYGMRLYNVTGDFGDSVTVRYKGQIGTPDFECLI